MGHRETTQKRSVQIHLPWVIELKRRGRVARVDVVRRIHVGLVQITCGKNKAFTRTHDEFSLWRPRGVRLAAIDLSIAKGRGIQEMPDFWKSLDPPPFHATELQRYCGFTIGVRVALGASTWQGEPEFKGFIRFHAIGQARFKKIRSSPVLLYGALRSQRLLILYVPHIGSRECVCHVLRMPRLGFNLCVPIRVLQIDVILSASVLRAHVARGPTFREVLALQVGNSLLIEIPSAVIHNEWHTIAHELVETGILQVLHSRDLSGSIGSLETEKFPLRGLLQDRFVHTPWQWPFPVAGRCRQ